mgnify:CR=1 FL=1
MPWNLSNDRPIYLQIVELLGRRILAGKYNSGERFPTVRELAAEASVNPNTMQKALQELERKGLLITNRTTGRTITEDEELIDKLRKEFANECLADFQKEMNELGYSNESLLSFVKENLT